MLLPIYPRRLCGAGLSRSLFASPLKTSFPRRSLSCLFVARLTAFSGFGKVGLFPLSCGGALGVLSADPQIVVFSISHTCAGIGSQHYWRACAHGVYYINDNRVAGLVIHAEQQIMHSLNVGAIWNSIVA